nr:hypothetical protein [Lachnospiraceae bacterium]
NALISELDHVVKIRENVKYLFADDQSYIGQQFQKEIDNALSLRKSFISFMEEKPKQIQSQKISNE